MAAAAIVVVVVLLALLVKSCASSQTNSALIRYNASVSDLITRSDTTGAKVFHNLTTGNLNSVDLLTHQVQAADTQLRDAEGLSTPSQMADAQSALLFVMRLRAQAITEIATQAPLAASKSTSKDAVYNISKATYRLAGSDVMYKTFVVTGIAKALNGAGIPIGPTAGEQQINAGQILPDLGWLQTTWIAEKIGAQLSTAQANANNDQPNLAHGDQLNSTTVDGTTLADGGTYTVPAANAQTWTLSVTNGGQTVENQVGCSVKIENVSDVGTSVIPTISPGETKDCVVRLSSKPPAGPYSVTADVAAVPGEKNLQNNRATYTITFN